MKKIFGFRSGKTWKSIIAVVAYGFFILMILAIIFGKSESKISTVPPANKVTTTTVVPVTTPTPIPTPTPVITPKESTFENVIYNLSNSEVKASIKSDAEDEWKTNYQMVQFQIKTQTESYDNLKNISIKSKVQEDILKDALSEWKNNFQMIKFQYETQMKAYDDLNK